MLRDLFAWRFQILDSDRMQKAQRKLEDALVPLFAGDQGQHEAEAHAHLLGQLIGLDYGRSPHIVHIRDDARQIRRWRAIARHVAAIRKHCEPGDLECRRRQRQAVLHWAYDSRKI